MCIIPKFLHRWALSRNSYPDVRYREICTQMYGIPKFLRRCALSRNSYIDEHYPEIRTQMCGIPKFEQFITKYLQTPPVRAGCDTRSIFKGSQTCLNSVFSFSYTNCDVKVKEHSLPYYLPHTHTHTHTHIYIYIYWVTYNYTYT